MQQYADMVVFAKVVAYQSFSAAAERLGTTPSVVSKHVSRLEKTLGVRLLNRTTRKLSLTEAGTAVFEHCERMSIAADAGAQAAGQFVSEAMGCLKLSAPAAFGRLLVVPRLPELLGKYPGLTVEAVLQDGSVDFVDGRYDLAITSELTAGADLVAKKLTSIEWIVCATQEYLARKGVPTRPSDLERHECVFFRSRATQGDVWRFKCQDEQIAIKVRGSFVVNDSEAVREATLRGLGIGLLPTYVFYGFNEQATLRRVLPDYRPVGNFGPDIWLQFVSAIPLLQKIRVCVDFFTSRIQADLQELRPHMPDA
jgi:DNA-binding transcriptional LysR family regulator